MTKPAADPLLARILYDRAMSGGRMPLEIIVADGEEKARAIALCRGLKNTKNLSFVTLAERQARRRQARRDLLPRPPPAA